MKIYSLILISSLMCSLSWAKDASSVDFDLLNCQEAPIKFEQEQVQFIDQQSKPMQRLYLIHNISKSSIWLDHPVEEPHASAGWASTLSPDHWSAIALNDSAFALICVEQNPGSEQVIPCKSVLKVCEVKNIRFSKESQGRYWAAENKPLEKLLYKIKSRNIEIHF